nr:hypothetical protein CFP56_70414 [Quercus suber]
MAWHTATKPGTSVDVAYVGLRGATGPVRTNCPRTSPVRVLTRPRHAGDTPVEGSCTHVVADNYGKRLEGSRSELSHAFPRRWMATEHEGCESGRLTQVASLKMFLRLRIAVRLYESKFGWIVELICFRVSNNQPRIEDDIEGEDTRYISSGIVIRAPARSIHEPTGTPLRKDEVESSKHLDAREALWKQLSAYTATTRRRLYMLRWGRGRRLVDLASSSVQFLCSYERLRRTSSGRGMRGIAMGGPRGGSSHEDLEVHV